MKTVVIDTNIIFTTLLGKNKKFRDIILSPKSINLYSCKYTILELFKYKEKIQKYSELEEEEILELLYNILKRIHLYDENTLTEESLNRAFSLCNNIDKKDIPIVAVTIELDGLLWTGDKQLKKGLKSKDFNSFYEIE